MTDRDSKQGPSSGAGGTGGAEGKKGVSSGGGKPSVPPEKTIGRLSLYRRLLGSLLTDFGEPSRAAEGPGNVYSHQLAEAAGVTAALVRRDLMALGYSGSPKHGYDVRDLVRSIDEYLDAPGGQRVALIGVGNLGRALLAFFRGRRPKLEVRAAFDSDPAKVNEVVSGCKVYSVGRLRTVVKDKSISIAIIAVPAPEAQAVADACAEAGVKGILNFAPIPLKVPPSVYVSDIDLTMALEKAAFFARPLRPGKG